MSRCDEWKVMDNLVFGLASAIEWLVVVVSFTKRRHMRGEVWGWDQWHAMVPMREQHGLVCN